MILKLRERCKSVAKKKLRVMEKFSEFIFGFAARTKTHAKSHATDLSVLFCNKIKYRRLKCISSNI